MLKVKTKILKASVVALAIILIAVFYSLSLKPLNRLPWHQQMVVSILSPLQKSITFIGKSISGVWEHYFDLVETSRENIHLRKKVERQSYKLHSLAEAESENSRLRLLMGFKNRFELDGVGALVLANDPRGDFRAIVIDKGSSDGVEVDMPVVGASGLVGRVVEAAAGDSRVLLITDPNSAVDVMSQRSRARALLVGTMVNTEVVPNYYMSRLEYLHRKSDVLNGDTLVTSGLDRVYPPGIPVGVVTDIKHDSYGVFKEAKVISFMDFHNLEEVFIVKR